MLSRPRDHGSNDLPAAVRALLGLIFAAYLGLAAGYALATPRWNNPDEPAHFNYLREVAETGRLPVLQVGDWDAELLERQKASRFPDDAAIDSIRYEGHQPPLYYLIAGAAYRLTDGLPLGTQILALKGLSILLGGGVVASAYAAGRIMWPKRPAVALLAAATAAFVPMHTAMAAAINNDSLGNALAALTCLALLKGVRTRFDDRTTIVLGLLLGALVLTKLTSYFWVPLALAVVSWTEIEHIRAAGHAASAWSVARRPILATAVAAGVSGWWLVRNVAVYGWTDPLAAARHDAVVVGQPRWEQLDLGAGDYLARVIFRSFWGQFGWMGVVLEDRLYLLYLALTLLAALGLAGVGLDRMRSRYPAEPTDVERRRWRAGAYGVLCGAILLAIGALAYYNTRFIQAQGRYLFPALVPIAVLLSIGWCRVANGVCGRRRVDAPLAGALLAALAWALLDAAAPLVVGGFWPLRLVLPAAVLAGAGVVCAPRIRRVAVGSLLPLAVGVALGLLNLLCLLRFVGPAFR